MSELLHQLILRSSNTTPNSTALQWKKEAMDYQTLAQTISQVASGLMGLGLSANERVAIYLPKQFEAVCSFFGTSMAGGVFVPVNPLLKSEQVGYILRDCNVRTLITSMDRLALLEETLEHCHDLQSVVLVNTATKALPELKLQSVLRWEELIANGGNSRFHRRIDSDMVSILYTSGSTGKPKGVVLSHKNMVTGAKSVAEYLQNTAQDKLLAVLPFSFDYGFSQLSTAFHVGAEAVLMDYLLPRDVVKAVARYGITGLAGVPPLWNQLGALEWPQEAIDCLRYMTNSGGAMPKTTLASLRSNLPKSDFYLMYGLTEAFRSTYLPPSEIDKRPDSMGKAIPNAEVMVVREDGSPCAPGEPGELVHRGSLVSLGYWNDPEKTAERFKPTPSQVSGLVLTELAVWSGDTVKMDEDGYLYFVGRKDDMIKSSGYRISPSEVEEIIYASGLTGENVALGIPHPILGQAVVIVATVKTDDASEETLLSHCKQHLPNFMVPIKIIFRELLPRNPNGKIDRKALAIEYADIFNETN
ncbi:MAG: acyl-CoA ligase (AMP-forming), exosortase A system-associated [Gammaproteobacteria bacterium]|nr:acyl-CoA ligase (AMP-forming), exosortase A system-associated [Gammaproteobacteria bacterium]